MTIRIMEKEYEDGRAYYRLEALTGDVWFPVTSYQWNTIEGARKEKRLRESGGWGYNAEVSYVERVVE